MKAYLQEFFREFSYAAGDAQILTDAYDIIAANSQANALFTSAVDAYEKDICIDYATEIFDKAKQVAKMANLHPYTVTLLAFICLTKRLKAVYLERGLDMQIYKDSVLDLRWKLDECKAVRGICGTFLESWFPGFFKLERFALGRVQFELIPAGFDYDKNGVKIVKDESTLVNVHIPRTGTPLDKEICDKAYQAAREFFRAENGETYPFVCWSWLLFPDNKQLFSEKSNTYRFLSEYDIIDVDYDNGENLWRLFDTEERNPDRLPTDTRVRRNYVAYLKSGKRVGWGLGIKL